MQISHAPTGGGRADGLRERQGKGEKQVWTRGTSQDAPPSREGRWRWTRPCPSQSLQRGSGWERLPHQLLPCQGSPKNRLFPTVPHFHGEAVRNCITVYFQSSTRSQRLARDKRIVPTCFLSSLGPCPAGVRRLERMYFGWKRVRRVTTERAEPHLTSDGSPPTGMLSPTPTPRPPGGPRLESECSAQPSSTQPARGPVLGAAGAWRRVVNPVPWRRLGRVGGSSVTRT